ncbi:MAG TPA: hypothetical protein VNQ77_12115 [Frankiaceae bacterium]|nr:hypothetical protein [Frankiaceae bacterium]
MRTRPLLLALLLVALPACTEDKKPPYDPDAPLKEARARLAVLAQATANGAYDAQYRFLQLPSNTAGVIRIRQSPPQYRIDIVSKDGASFFALKSGIVSCSSKASKKTCFLVARPGEEVPALFDPGVQRLFRDAVEDLAANPNGYIVRRVDPVPTATPVSATPTPTPTKTPSKKPVSPTPSLLPIPVGECFEVTRTIETPDPQQPSGFENGTYCFAEQGVATSINVKSGTMTLVKLLGPPPAAAFKPPAKVQKLPELTPTPTPSKKK